MLISGYLLLQACSLSKEISKKAQKEVLSQPGFSADHFGISVYDPAKGKSSIITTVINILYRQATPNYSLYMRG